MGIVTKRSPVLGFNHNLRYRGVLFHVQTEDSGPGNPHIFTHVFHGGTILSTRKHVYDAKADESIVKNLMQAQHKALMKELRKGAFDDKIDKHLSHLPELQPAGVPHDVPPEPTQRTHRESTADAGASKGRSEYSMSRKRSSSVVGVPVERFETAARPSRPSTANDLSHAPTRSIAAAAKAVAGTGPAPILRPRPPSAPPTTGRPRSATMQRLPRTTAPSSTPPTYVVRDSRPATPSRTGLSPATKASAAAPISASRPGLSNSSSRPGVDNTARPRRGNPPSNSPATDKTLDDVILSFLNDDDKKR